MQVRNYSPNPSRSAHGQSILEFAILLPLLMLIVVGILDLGRLSSAYVVITNAAREGARYGASHQADGGNLNSNITARARAEATGTGINPSQMQVSCVSPTPTPSTCTGTAGTAPIRVQVTYPFNFITTNLFAGLSTINITTNATFLIMK
jgi:Flp pilus assembly protein TadG